ATVTAWVTTKTKMAGRGVIEGLTFIPWAFPGTALAIGLLWTYVYVPLLIYGTDEGRAGDGGLVHQRLVGGHVGGDAGASGSARAPRRLVRPVPREPQDPRDHGARGAARRPPRLRRADF